MNYTPAAPPHGMDGAVRESRRRRGRLYGEEERAAVRPCVLSDLCLGWISGGFVCLLHSGTSFEADSAPHFHQTTG